MFRVPAPLLLEETSNGWLGVVSILAPALKHAFRLPQVWASGLRHAFRLPQAWSNIEI
jgi:hypothetical protein